MSDVLVVGGGAAGMFAAYHAAAAGHKVTIIEQNEKLGKKIYITGKGRCNLTNAGDMEDLFSHVVSNAKFLYSAFYACDNQRVMDFFEEYGVPLKVERGNRVFPVSDHSSDIIRALQKALQQKKVRVELNTKVEGLQIRDGAVTGVILAGGVRRDADWVILATGGASYPATGSTGDGYRFAAECGHTLVPVTPSLVPFEIKEPWCARLQGLALKNVMVRVWNGSKCLFAEQGEMLFTHFGVSGPLILSASAAIPPELYRKHLSLTIDLKPALSEEQLDRRALRDFEEAKNRQFQNAVVHLMPASMIPVLTELSGILPEKKVNGISKEERSRFVACMKNMQLTITGTRGFAEAIITKGGISVKEINPSNMKSKKIGHLSVCGELLDLDAYTGGYNLQIAWSTGYLAGSSIE